MCVTIKTIAKPFMNAHKQIAINDAFSVLSMSQMKAVSVYVVFLNVYFLFTFFNLSLSMPV